MTALVIVLCVAQFGALTYLNHVLEKANKAEKELKILK